MKKIGIITITDYVNYGNRLQNYATQEILKSYGFYVETIKNIPKTEKIDNVEFTKYRLKNALKLSPYTLVLKFIEKINEKINYKKYIRAQKLKETSFREFSKKYITESSYVISESYIPEKFDEKFDYFVVGSDQIWNPNLRKGSSFDFIQFAPKGKRIALAPSFGVSIIPDEYKDLYSKWLNEMNFLSIREQKGADLINKLCGRSAEVLIDPTLMLTKQQWLEINESAKLKPNKKYLLTYFIGIISKKRNLWLKDFAKKHNLEIVQLACIHDFERYNASPSEFIDYINSASIICTDSFHAIIFSMQMEKPFVVFDREGKSAPMSSRIDTLLSKFQFEDRKFSELIKTQKWFEINFTQFSIILDNERKKATDYLTKALN